MKPYLQTYGVSLLSGLALGLAFPAWHWWPVAWVALIPLFYRASSAQPFISAGHFFLAGVAFHIIVLQWLATNVYWAGGWAMWGYLLLCMYMALYWGLLGALLAWLLPRLPLGVAALATGTLWAAMEFAQARMFTGFGWSALGYSQGPDVPFLQWASVGSVVILGFVVAAFNALLAYALAFRKARWVHIAGALALVAGVHAVGFLLIEEANYGTDRFRVGIIQSDFPLEMKWDEEYRLEMVRNAAEKSQILAGNEPVDLFVWPESLVMHPIETPGIFEVITTLTRETQTPLYTGSMRLEGGSSYNSSHLVLPSGVIGGEYDKIHLAPFGEYVPLSRLIPFIGSLIPAIGDMTPGTEAKVLTTDARTFGPLICFEVLFPAMAEHLRAEGAQMLVVITNLGWFGASNAIPEELEIARLRAVETRLPLVHAANTGISGVFDPYGRFSVVHSLVDTHGQFRNAPRDIDPRLTVMQRLVGAFDVALPVSRPVRHGPIAFPWLMVLLTFIFLILGLIRRPRGEH